MTIVKDEIDHIDPESKKIFYTSGREAPLSEQADFALFSSPAQKQLRENTSQSERDWYEKGPIPKSATAFTKKFAESNIFSKLATDYVLDPAAAGARAIQPGEGQEDMGFFDRLGENYIAQRMGRRDASQEIQSNHPTATKIAGAASLGADIFMPLPKGISGSPAATGALYGAGASDRSLFEDPEGFAKSTAIGTGLGYGLGKVGNQVERVASERRSLRAFEKSEAEANRVYKESFNDYERLQKEADSAYTKAKEHFGKREVESQRIYQESLQDYQRLSEESQVAYQDSVGAFRVRMGEKIQAMQKDLGSYGINKASINLDEFISNYIGVSAKSGTKEAKEASRFLESVYESLPETLQAADVSRLFEAVETKMLQGGEFQGPLMQSFKRHLMETLPLGAAQNKLMGKIFPRVEKKVINLVDKLVERLPKNVIKTIEEEFGKGAVQSWKQQISKELRDRFGSISPDEFIEILTKKDSSRFVDVLTDNELYRSMIDFAAHKATNKFPGIPKHSRALVQRHLPPSVFEAQTRFQQIPGELDRGISEFLGKQALEGRIIVHEAENKITSRLSHATGVPNPNTGRAATNAPVPPYEAPVPLPKLNKGQEPVRPGRLDAPQSPIPGNPPTVGRTAQRFETQPLKAGEKGAFAAGTMGLGKLLGIPGVGKVAAGIQGGKLAVEGTLRGITDPGVIASYGRSLAGDQGLKFTVETISGYPSYSHGVLRDPQERKQAVAEIESDGSIVLEDKAILQAYINRGKNLESLIRG